MSLKRGFFTRSYTHEGWKRNCTGSGAIPCGDANGSGLEGYRETGLLSSGHLAQGLVMLAHKASKTTFALLVGEDSR